MPHYNLWLTTTFGRKFGHEYMSDEDENLEDAEYPAPLSKHVNNMINDIKEIYNKNIPISDKFDYNDNLNEVTFSLNVILNHLPRDIFERTENFFRFVAEKYPASYGTCYMFGDEPPLEDEIVVLKMVGKTIQRERDPFFLKYLPKYVEPEE